MRLVDQREHLLLCMKNFSTRLLDLYYQCQCTLFPLSCQTDWQEFFTIQLVNGVLLSERRLIYASFEMSASSWVTKARHDLYVLHIFSETCQCLTRMHMTNDLLQITFKPGHTSSCTHTTSNKAEVFKIQFISCIVASWCIQTYKSCFFPE